MKADKSEPSVAKFEAFDNNNDGDNNDTRAPGHENEYLLPATPERVTRVTSAVTSQGSVWYFILQRILQSNCYNSIHIERAMYINWAYCICNEQKGKIAYRKVLIGVWGRGAYFY